MINLYDCADTLLGRQVALNIIRLAPPRRRRRSWASVMGAGAGIAFGALLAFILRGGS